MLERLTIHNFQIHRKLTIDFDPYITVLTAPSDTGKSAVLRSLRLVCFNLPSGTAFISHGEDQTKIVLKADGHKIVRTRSKSVNEYSLDGKEYKAFGQGNVPDEIEKLLNVGDINWQRQHDPPFWFSLTAGQVSKELNAIINLGLIDDALSSVASELRKARSAEDVTQGRLKEAEDRKAELAWVPELNERLKAVEQLYTRKEETALKRSRIADLIEKAVCHEKEAVSRSKAISAAANVLRLGKLTSEAAAKRKKLETSIQEFTEREGQLCRLRQNAKDSSTELQKQTGGICPVCSRPMM